MKDLMEALSIMLKYADPRSPTHCEHDVLLFDVSSEGVSAEDLARLAELGVIVDDETGRFISYRYGSF